MRGETILVQPAAEGVLSGHDAGDLLVDAPDGSVEFAQSLYHQGCHVYAAHSCRTQNAANTP